MLGRRVDQLAGQNLGPSSPSENPLVDRKLFLSPRYSRYSRYLLCSTSLHHALHAPAGTTILPQKERERKKKEGKRREENHYAAAKLTYKGLKLS